MDCHVIECKKMKKNQHQISMIDMEVMKNIFGNNFTIIHDYIKRFTKTTAALLKKAENAIQQKNIELALDYFHQLKGPVGSIGFKKMYQLCEKIEERISHADWVAANALYNQIEELLKKLQVECEKKFKD